MDPALHGRRVGDLPEARSGDFPDLVHHVPGHSKPGVCKVTLKGSGNPANHRSVVPL